MILVYTPVSLKIAQSEVAWLFRVLDCVTTELTATRSPVFYLPSVCRCWECWECSLSQGARKTNGQPFCSSWWFPCCWAHCASGGGGNACDVLPYLFSGCPLPSKYLSILNPRKGKGSIRSLWWPLLYAAAPRGLFLLGWILKPRPGLSPSFRGLWIPSSAPPYYNFLYPKQRVLSQNPATGGGLHCR